NMPRTQVTICGAPKEIAIPRIAAMHQPQEMRFAIAMAPRTMTRMTATGVSHARRLVSSAVAPVRKGEAWAWARAESVLPPISPRVKRSGATKDRTRLAFPMMLSSNVPSAVHRVQSVANRSLAEQSDLYRLREPWNHAGAVARD